MNYAQILSKNIRIIRGIRSQAEFAKEIGITKSTVQAMEKGKSVPRLDTLDVICEHLGMPIAALLSEDGTVEHLNMQAALLRNLDWYIRLPKGGQTALVAWLRQTADLYEALPGQLEDA